MEKIIIEICSANILIEIGVAMSTNKTKNIINISFHYLSNSQFKRQYNAIDLDVQFFNCLGHAFKTRKGNFYYKGFNQQI